MFHKHIFFVIHRYKKHENYLLICSSSCEEPAEDGEFS